MIKMSLEERTKLAADLKEWRGEATMRQAAEVLAIPYRTYEGIEMGRGFNYPKFLRLAMKTWKAPKNGK